MSLMGEWKLFESDIAEVSTEEYHADRERGRHLEQDIDRERLQVAAILCLVAQQRLTNEDHTSTASVSDLGCGDGGLLSLLARHMPAWGYDFTPANAAGWVERGVQAESLDFLSEAGEREVQFGDITAATEVLEHLTDPHSVVRWISKHSRYIVASSPWDETDVLHCDCHSWAWDMEGYRALIEQGGYTILYHVQVGRFQVVLGERA